MPNKIHKTTIKNKLGVGQFPVKFDEYISILREQKMSDFFNKTEMIIRLARAQSITLYRCSRWVETKQGIVPEWHHSISWYLLLAQTLNIPLHVFVSTFDLKTEANKVLMYEQKEKFEYEIVSHEYESSVQSLKEKLIDMMRVDRVFSQKIRMVQGREQAKFRKLNNLLLSFAEYCAGAQYAHANNSALFVHDTRRITVIRYLEKRGVIPKVPFVPLLRRNQMLAI